MVLRLAQYWRCVACYETSSTDIAYGPTRALHLSYPLPVLTSGMVVPGGRVDGFAVRGARADLQHFADARYALASSILRIVLLPLYQRTPLCTAAFVPAD
eukprot:966879-Rhodomonas_salina.2